MAAPLPTLEVELGQHPEFPRKPKIRSPGILAEGDAREIAAIQVDRIFALRVPATPLPDLRGQDPDRAGDAGRRRRGWWCRFPSASQARQRRAITARFPQDVPCLQGLSTRCPTRYLLSVHQKRTRRDTTPASRHGFGCACSPARVATRVQQRLSCARNTDFPATPTRMALPCAEPARGAPIAPDSGRRRGGEAAARRPSSPKRQQGGAGVGLRNGQPNRYATRNLCLALQAFPHYEHHRCYRVCYHYGHPLPSRDAVRQRTMDRHAGADPHPPPGAEILEHSHHFEIRTALALLAN
jgi:hypothetical protein